MKISNTKITLQTKKEYDLIDLTDQIINFVKESKIKNGLVNIQTLHTTATLILNENEPLLWKDFQRHLENLSPKTLEYQHDNFKIRTVNLCSDECANGHSHCKAILLSPTLTLNLINNKLQLGQWQRIIFIELDRSRKREIQIQIIGV